MYVREISVLRSLVLINHEVCVYIGNNGSILYYYDIVYLYEKLETNFNAHI